MKTKPSRSAAAVRPPLPSLFNVLNLVPFPLSVVLLAFLSFFFFLYIFLYIRRSVSACTRSLQISPSLTRASQ